MRKDTSRFVPGFDINSGLEHFRALCSRAQDHNLIESLEVISAMSRFKPKPVLTRSAVGLVILEQELYSLGGRNIAVLGLPPFGCLPSQIALHGTLDSDVCVTELNNVAISFNSGLQALINEMRPSMPGSRLFYVDIYSLLYTVYHNPTVYGTDQMP